MAETKTTSPIWNRKRIDGETGLIELPWSGKINIRGDATQRKFVKQAESVLGLELPLEVNTCKAKENKALYCLGPNEWLLHCEMPSTDSLMSKLDSGFSGIHSAVVNVSDYYTVLRLDGPDASTLLAKACPMDLYPGIFTKGMCAQTRFGNASILLHKISETPAYDIQVRWSFAEYVWDYLVSGMGTI